MKFSASYLTLVFILISVSNSFSQNRLHIGLDLNINKTNEKLDDTSGLLEHQSLYGWQPGLNISYDFPSKLRLISGVVYKEYYSPDEYKIKEFTKTLIMVGLAMAIHTF